MARKLYIYVVFSLTNIKLFIQYVYVQYVVKRILELTFWTAVLRCNEGVQSETSVLKLFSLPCISYQFIKLFQ